MFSLWTPQHRRLPLPTTHLSSKNFHNPAYMHEVLCLAGSYPGHISYRRTCISLQYKHSFNGQSEPSRLSFLHTLYQMFCKSENTKGEKKSHLPTQQNDGAAHSRDHDCSATELALQERGLFVPQCFVPEMFQGFY